jgi:hypothetical protein
MPATGGAEEVDAESHRGNEDEACYHQAGARQRALEDTLHAYSL